MEYIVRIKDYIQITCKNIDKVDDFIRTYGGTFEYEHDDPDFSFLYITRKDYHILCPTLDDYICIGENNEIYIINQEAFENLIEKKC